MGIITVTQNVNSYYIYDKIICQHKKNLIRGTWTCDDTSLLTHYFVTKMELHISSHFFTFFFSHLIDYQNNNHLEH